MEEIRPPASLHAVARFVLSPASEARALAAALVFFLLAAHVLRLAYRKPDRYGAVD